MKHKCLDNKTIAEVVLELNKKYYVKQNRNKRRLDAIMIGKGGIDETNIEREISVMET